MLFGHDYNAHFSSMVLGIIVLQIDEAYTHTVGFLDDETQLPIVEKVVCALGNVLFEGIMREWHRCLPAAPQLGIVLDEIHEVEVFRLDSSQL